MVIHPVHYGTGLTEGMGVCGPSCIVPGYGCRILKGRLDIGDKMVFRKKEYICEKCKRTGDVDIMSETLKRNWI